MLVRDEKAQSDAPVTLFTVDSVLYIDTATLIVCPECIDVEFRAATSYKPRKELVALLLMG